jgi:hypothetical protein
MPVLELIQLQLTLFICSTPRLTTASMVIFGKNWFILGTLAFFVA